MNQLISKQFRLMAVPLLFSLSLWMSAEAQVTVEWLAEYDGPGNGNDIASAMVLDPNGNIIVTGTGYGSSGSDDCITLKYDSNGGLLWVAIYNGPQNGMDAAEDLAVDTLGNVYVAGYSEGGESGVDFITVKYDSEGNEVWDARYSAPGNTDDFARAIALDSLGNVFVTGQSGGIGTGPDYATVKYDADGNRLWVSRYDGPGNGVDNPSSIAIDSTGSVFVTGLSDIDFDPVVTNYDIATIKYDTQGTELWIQHYNGPGNGGDGASSLSLDRDGNVIVAGNSNGGATMKDYTVLKYTSDGVLVWEARYHGVRDGSDKIYALKIDDLNNIYVTGESDGFGTDKDYVTIKYSPDGQEQWVDRYDGTGSGYDIAFAVGVDDNFNVFVTGYSWSLNESFDIATVAYDSMGAELWVAYYEGSAGGFDRAYSLQVDEESGIYIAGASDVLPGSAENDNYLTIKYVQSGEVLDITLTPLGSTTFPSSGGILSYDIAIDNSGVTVEIVDIWVDVTLPDGSLFGPVLGPLQDFTLSPGFSTNRERALSIPAGAPAGTYSLNAYIGDFSPVSPTILAEDHFEFIKMGSEINEPMGFQLTSSNNRQGIVGIPETIEIWGAYPNPFNPSTTISFALPQDSKVLLSVYDVNGRLVETLVNGNRSAGVHDVTFDASSLSSGVYLYRLEAGDFNAAGKMILMK